MMQGALPPGPPCKTSGPFALLTGHLFYSLRDTKVSPKIIAMRDLSACNKKLNLQQKIFPLQMVLFVRMFRRVTHRIAKQQMGFT